MLDLPFAAAFPPVEEARWRELASAALKGQPLEKLNARSYDGIAIQPLYRSGKPAAAQPAKAANGPAANAWSVVARVDHPDAAQANALAVAELENGASGLQIVFAGAAGAYGFGLKSPADLTRALENIYLDFAIAVEIDAPGHGREAADAIAKLVADRKIDPKSTAISFGLDPVGAALRGAVKASFDDIAPHFAETVKKLKAAGFNGPFAVADARLINAAGGAEAQELAYALGAAAQMLRALEHNGMSLDEARRAIAFRIAVDADEFLGIAKLRALRRLWARVEEACGLTPVPATIHAETAWRMMTRRDPYVNMLRTTVAVFAAGIGGADRVSVLPFTQAIGLPDEFARRAARNTQLVLLEESNLDKVVDPTAGAGGFEALTEALCEKAWALFQKTEAAGGVLAARDALAADIAAVRAERTKNIARRKEPLTGASEFPDIAEQPAGVLAPIPAQPPQGAFAPHRLAENFEALRDRSDALAAKGARPSVFLANIGPIAAFNARATFAKNFFEAGGIAAMSNDGYATPSEAAAAFAASGAKLVCICSSDKLYADLAVEAARALKAQGAKAVILAGRPGDLEAPLKEAGVTDFVFAGADVLAALERAWSALG